MFVHLCTKQSPPAYSRLLWVCAPSRPSQAGDQAPLPPCQVVSSSPERSVPLLPSLPANVKGPGIEKQNPSRRARHLPPSRRFQALKPQSSPKWNLSPLSEEFPGQCTKSCSQGVLGNKLTPKDNADSRMQFIIPVGPRQSLLLAKDPD